MTPKTLAALKGSIKKWEKIVAGTGVDEGTLNCDLCLTFLSKACVGCPVATDTGHRDCAYTPYYAWMDHQKMAHDHEEEFRVYCPECTRLAQAELDFLRALLPEDER